MYYRSLFWQLKLYQEPRTGSNNQATEADWKAGFGRIEQASKGCEGR